MGYKRKTLRNAYKKIQIYVTDAEFEEIGKLACKQGKSLSAFLFDCYRIYKISLQEYQKERKINEG